MFVLVRALVWATLFIAFVLVALPAQVLNAAGVSPPAVIGLQQVAGIAVGALGSAMAVACIVSFIVVGNGTPAPFDPPRRLVVRGPYRLVRNPMYLGAAIAMSGAALFYASWALLAYALAFIAVTHVFVVAYEEPTLRRLFDGEYDRYCADVHRWRVSSPQDSAVRS